MTSAGMRAVVRERGVGWFATCGLVLSLAAAFIGGYVWGLHVHPETAVFAAFECLVLFGWVGVRSGRSSASSSR